MILFVQILLVPNTMTMNFDDTFVADTTRRLEDLPADKKPLWGLLTAPGLLGHLTEAVRYSLGLQGDIPQHDTFVSRNIIRPLILNGVIPIPKGVMGVELPFETGDLETLKLAMSELVDALEQKKSVNKPHPLFGPLTVNQWERFHVLHFQHHLKQFDL